MACSRMWNLCRPSPEAPAPPSMLHADSSRSLLTCMSPSIRRHTRMQASGMSTGSLMTWSHRWGCCRGDHRRSLKWGQPGIVEAMQESEGAKGRYQLRDVFNVLQALKSSGGFVWACKNYDGDVQSDIVAQVCACLLYITCNVAPSRRLPNSCVPCQAPTTCWWQQS